MQGSDYIMCFQDKSFNFWRVNTDGTVSISAQPYFLDFAPAGWEDVAIQNIRNKKYWGVDRSVTIPLAYVNDGATILKHIFYTLGIEEPVFLVIASQRLDYTAGVSYGYWYKQIYRGEADLSTFNHTGARVTCTSLEDGLAKYLKANEATVYELPMNVAEAIYVKMDGINLHEALNYQDTDGLEILLSDVGSNFRLPVNFINNEGDSIGIVMQSQSVVPLGSLTWAQKQALDDFEIKNVGTTAVSLTITGKVEFYCTKMVSSPAWAYKARFVRSNQLIGNQNDYQMISTAAMVVGQLYSHDISLTVPLAPGEKLASEGIFFGGVGSDAGITFTENSKFKVTFITRYNPTYILAFRSQYLLNQLINKVTETAFAAELSDYLTAFRNIAFTSGNAIRNLDDATMKICFADFFQFWDCFDSVGLIERIKTVGFDAKKNLVDTIDYIDLPEPASDSFKVTVAKEYLFNELNIGYPEIKNDVGVLNGNEEFNTKFIFSLGTTKSPAVIDKVSKFKASCYEIEKIRVTTLDLTTTDYKADNEVFVLHIENVLQPAVGVIPAYYNLDRALNATATGLIEPATVFNLFLSPKRNLLRNGPFMRSSMYLADNKTLAFTSADKNSNLVCGGVIEKDNINLGNLGDKFFLPVLFDGDFPAPDDQLELLESNPLQVFRFPFYGNYYKGILVKASIAPSSRKSQAYQLLSIPGNDLQKLNDYYGG